MLSPVKQPLLPHLRAPGLGEALRIPHLGATAKLCPTWDRVSSWLNVLAVWAAFSCAGADTLDLAGTWRLRLDAADEGLAAGWPAAPLEGDDRITLPNTTDLAGFGFALDTNTMLHPVPFPATTRFPGVKEPVRADEHGYLVRRHLYVGPAWYEREVEIPAAWARRPVALRLERALWQTEVWVDGRRIGA